MSEITLFIEDSAIKLLVTKGRRVEKWANMPLEPGLVSDGLIHDETRVADKIKELFGLQKVGAGTVIAGLGGFNSVFRLVSLPPLPATIIPEAAKQEASRVIPVPLEEVYLSYQAVPAPEGETRLFLAAFPRNTTDALLRTLQKAGLRADTLDLAPLALCRAVDAPKAVIVDVCAASLDIAILVGRVPEVTRSLSLPGEAQSLAERLPAITEELNRTIAFYNSSHRDMPLETTVPVFVSGDLATAPESWQSLGGTAGHPVSVLPSPMQPVEGFDPSQFMINIGLALKRLPLEKEGANFSVVNFNALPTAEKPKKAFSPVSVLLPIVIVLGIGGIYYMFNLVQHATAQNNTLRDQIALIQSQIPQHQEAIATVKEEIAQLEPQIEPLKATARIFDTTFATLEEGRNRVDQDLSQVAGLTPDEIALLYGGELITGYASPLGEANINYSGERVTVEGRSKDVAAIFKYARDLRASGRFSQVVISSIEASEEIIPPEEGEEETAEEVIKGFNFRFLLVHE